MMSKLSEQQRDFLRLVGRSLKGNNWAPVSNLLWDFAQEKQSEMPSLVKIDKENQQVGLTDEGQIVLDGM